MFPPLQIFCEDFMQNLDYFALKYLLEFPREAVFDWSFLCRKPFTINDISLINREPFKLRISS